MASDNIEKMCRSALRRVRRVIDARAAAAREDITLAFQRARRERRLPPIMVPPWGWLLLPKRFECPECGARVFLEVDEWSTATGTPTPGGVRVMCEEEEKELWRAMRHDEDPAWSHRNWQSDWQPLVDRVERFCASAVRVYPGA